MESRYKRGILRALDITGNMIAIAVCLLWLVVSNNKLVNYFRKRDDAVVNRGKRTLNLTDIIVPELGRKYLQSCR